MFGLESPRLDDKTGDILAADQQVLDAPKDLGSFRRFAALDEIDLQPPAGDEFPVLLATISGLTLQNTAGTLTLTAANLDVTVRPSLVATAVIQELLCGSLVLPGSPLPVAASVKLDTANSKLTFVVTAPLQTPLTPAQFSLSFFTGTAWQSATISAASFDTTSNTVEVDLDTTQPLPQTNQVIRFIAKGSGSAPLLGPNGVPFNNGRDFVHTQKWS